MESPAQSDIKTEVPEPDEEGLLGDSSTLDLNDEGLRTALIVGSEDLGPVGGKLQLQMEDQGEGELVFQYDCQSWVIQLFP